MKKNVGKLDKVVRIILGIFFIITALFYTSGNLRVLLVIASLAMFITSITNYCFLYTLFGINTCPVNLEDKKQ